MATLFQLPKTAPVSAGNSYPLAQLYFYQTGTTTPITVYTSAAFSTAHSSPVEADANGIFAPIYINEATYASYRAVLKTSAGSTVWDIDSIPSALGIASFIDDIFPRTAAEIANGTTPTSYYYQEGDPRRYGAAADGSTNDTTPVQTAINIIQRKNRGVLDLQGLHYVVGTLKIDANGFTLRNGKLTAHSSIPASGGIIVSLAGGSDATVNNGLLDAIYGASVQTVRTSVTGSLENVVIENVSFAPNSNAIKGVWFTGFTRGCVIRSCYFDGFDDDAICINGSWSFGLVGNYITGDGTNGVGIGLGRSGEGERSGSSVVNAPYIVGNEIKSHANGVIWNFGAGGLFAGNTVESNAADGFQSQSVAGASIVGNYFEANAGDNVQLGGTNGTDFFEGGTVSGNSFSATSGNNIRLQGVTNCKIGPNYFSGSVTQHYFIASGIGQYVTDNDLWVPAVSSTYISNAATEANTPNNNWHTGKGAKGYDSVTTTNGDYSFVLADFTWPPKVFYKASGGTGETWTLPANGTIAVPVGSRVDGVNMGGGNLTIAVTSDTITGTTTVPDGDRFTAIKVASTVWSCTVSS